GCPSAHTGRPWLSLAIRQHTQDDVCGCPSVHISERWSMDLSHWPFPCTVRVILAHVAVCLVHIGHPWFPSAHTGPHTGRPCVSVITHRTSVVLGLRTLTLPVDCSGDFGPRGLSVQYTQDVCGCLCVSVCVRQHTQDVRGCLCVSVCVHQHTQDVHQC
ncbi:unnamed protein product, partial [Brassica rapa]